MNSYTVKSPKNQGGFSLVEMLIVILIIGILSAIIAPSWFNFLNRQKLRSAEDQIYLALRNAQKEARYNKEILQVSIQNDGDISRWIIHPRNIDPTELTNWNYFDPAVQVDEETTFYQNSSTEIWKVEFNDRGHTNGRLGRITLSLRDNEQEKRCVFVSTLLGALRRGKNYTQPRDNRYCY